MKKNTKKSIQNDDIKILKLVVDSILFAKGKNFKSKQKQSKHRMQKKTITDLNQNKMTNRKHSFEKNTYKFFNDI